jgi:hypothetical protein
MITFQKDYIRLLNRTCCVNAHLVERFDEIRQSSTIAGYSDIIESTVNSLQILLENTIQIYEVLEIDMSFADNEPLIHFMEDLFDSVNSHDNGFSLFSLLDYINITDALLRESASLAETLSGQFSTLASPPFQLYDPLIMQPIKVFLLDAKTAV